MIRRRVGTGASGSVQEHVELERLTRIRGTREKENRSKEKKEVGNRAQSQRGWVCIRAPLRNLSRGGDELPLARTVGKKSNSNSKLNVPWKESKAIKGKGEGEDEKSERSWGGNGRSHEKAAPHRVHKANWQSSTVFGSGKLKVQIKLRTRVKGSSMAPGRLSQQFYICFYSCLFYSISISTPKIFAMPRVQAQTKTRP